MPLAISAEMRDSATPRPAKSGWITLIDDVTCAASGQFTNTGMFGTQDARFLHLYIEYDPAAANGSAGIYILGSAQETQPTTAVVDVWFQLAVWDGVATSTAASGAKPTSAPYTITPNLNACTMRAGLILTPPATGASDEIRLAYPAINLGGCRWVQLAYNEQGATGSPGNIRIYYNLST